MGDPRAAAEKIFLNLLGNILWTSEPFHIAHPKPF